MNEIILSTLGGMMIGAASLQLMRGIGKIAGISGVVDSVTRPFQKPERWQVLFSLGLLLAGFLGTVWLPERIVAPSANLGTLLVAGLLVGVGTRMANGCTSGHGICGLSRMSGRSLIAVLTFMFTGFLTRFVLGGIL